MTRSQPAQWGELAGLVRVRPLSEPLPEPSWGGSYSSPFSASLGSTLQVLRREVEHLSPDHVLLEADFRENQLRQDGLPKATASAASPGVVLTLVGVTMGDGRRGDLRYPCSTFHRWDDNLRGIALALEALRKVDRYGVTKSGEQYAGWLQLESPQSRLVARGRQLIAQAGGDVRRAMAEAHPDRGGDAEDFKAITAAREAA